MATPRMSDELMDEVIDLVAKHGGVTAAARATGIPRQTIYSRYERARARQNVDPAVKNSMDAIGTDMVPSMVWAKTGEYSVLLRPKEETPEDIANVIRETLEGMEPAHAVPAPEIVNDDLCTLYPIMDAHFGMRARKAETGDEDYDTELAAEDMRRAFSKVTAWSPDSKKAILLIGGDFFHADDNRAETPKSKNKLDVTGRQHEVIDEGIKIIAEVIDMLLHKHEEILLRVLRGNHDENAHMILTFALSERYREEERISVEKTQMDIFMMQWGKNLISAHHGDKAPPERLTFYLSDVCPFWSDTRHRFCFTGHVHHDRSKDLGPIKWESLRAFSPLDSYAAGMGFASRRALQAITFHIEDGLVIRITDPIR